MLVGELRDMSYYYGCQLSGHATLGIAEKIFELLSHLTTKKGGTLETVQKKFTCCTKFMRKDSGNKLLFTGGNFLP